MEHLFSPCTRLYDIFESQGDLEGLRYLYPNIVRELNLDVSTQELLNAERAFTYVDVYAMLGNGETVVWLTPHASVVRTNNGGGLLRPGYLDDEDFMFRVNVDGKDIHALSQSSEAYSEILDVVRRLLLAG
jgi:hypothetical protein